MPQRHRFPPFTAVVATRSCRHPRHRLAHLPKVRHFPPFSHSFRRSLETTPSPYSFRRNDVNVPAMFLLQNSSTVFSRNSFCHNGTVFRILLPLRYGPHRHTSSSSSLNSIHHPFLFHNGRISRNSLPLRQHVLHCIQPSHNKHSPLPQSLLSTHLHNPLIIHSLSQKTFYRLISCIAPNSLYTAYISTYTSLHLTVCKAQKR